MAAWSVYLPSGREIRRYKSKAAALALAKKMNIAAWNVIAGKTFTRIGVPIEYGKRPAGRTSRKA